MKELIQTIITALNKTISEVLGTKVLAAVGAYLTLLAAHQYDSATLLAMTFLGIGGVREVAKVVTAGKTETAAHDAVAAVAAAPTPAAQAAVTVAATLAGTAPEPTPAEIAAADISREEETPEVPDAPDPIDEDEPDAGF